MRLLIVKTSAIGDIIHAFPVVEYLKSRFPDATIDWVVEKNYKDLLTAHPFISNVLTISTQTWRKGLHRTLTWKEILEFRKEIRKQKYDILFDLQGNTKSAVVTAFADAAEKVGFGYNSVSEKLNLLATTQKYEVSKEINIQHAYLKVVQAHFNDLSPFVPQGVDLRLTEDEQAQVDRIVREGASRYLVALGSKWPNKQLSEETLKKFLKMVDREDQPYFYFIWGSVQEKEQADRLHAHFERSVVVDRLNLPSLQGLMRKMDLVISMDSMALHLAGKTASFSVFGPSLASVFKPLGAQHHHFQGSCPYGQVFPRRCPILRTCSTGACMKDINAEQLFASFQQMRKSV